MVWPTWLERIAAHGESAFGGLRARVVDASPRTRALSLRGLVELMNSSAPQDEGNPGLALSPQQRSEIVALLLAGLVDPEECVRGAAEAGIIHLKHCPPEMACTLLQRSREGQLPQAFVRRLLSLTLPESLPHVLICLDGLPSELRHHAREMATMAIGMRAGAIEVLIELAPSVSPASQVQAASVLCNFPASPGAGSALRDLAASGNAWVRVAAAQHLEMYERRRNRLLKALDQTQRADESGSR